MKFITLYIFHIFIISCVLTSSNNPDITFSVSESGLKTLENDFLPTLFTNKNFTIPYINLKQHIDFLGTIRLQ